MNSANGVLNLYTYFYRHILQHWLGYIVYTVEQHLPRQFKRCFTLTLWRFTIGQQLLLDEFGQAGRTEIGQSGATQRS